MRSRGARSDEGLEERATEVGGDARAAVEDLHAQDAGAQLRLRVPVRVRIDGRLELDDRLGRGEADRRCSTGSRAPAGAAPDPTRTSASAGTRTSTLTSRSPAPLRARSMLSWTSGPRATVVDRSGGRQVRPLPARASRWPARSGGRHLRGLPRRRTAGRHGRSARPRASSSSVRRLASGVRRSCEAPATNARWRRRTPRPDPSIRFRVRASAASSSCASIPRVAGRDRCCRSRRPRR